MAGEITVLLIDELGLRLEDAGAVNFTDIFKLEALNKAQYQLANMLHNSYLTELETLESALDWSGITATGYTFASLTYDPVFRGGQGIIKVGVGWGAPATSYIWATRIDLQKIKRVENTYLVGSDANPLYYVFKAFIFVSVTTYTLLKGKVLYHQFPTTMTTGADPSLNSSFHSLIVSLAEGMCWAMDNKLERRNAVLKAAFDEIKILNEKVTPTPGVGTQGRRRQ